MGGLAGQNISQNSGKRGSDMSGGSEDLSGLLSLMDHLPMGAILLAPNWRILTMNARAKRILDRDEWVISDGTGGIVLSHSARPPDVSTTRPSATRSELVLCRGRTTRERVGAIIVHIPGDPSEESDGEPMDRTRCRIALLMWDPWSIGDFVEVRFSKVYALTRAEAEVIRTLAETGDIVEYCRRRNVGAEAARGHLKAAFRKTSCDSRAKLLSLLLRSWTMYGGFAQEYGEYGGEADKTATGGASDGPDPRLAFALLFARGGGHAP
jgi:DNA-binding CsgD family transcriptional regulator